MIAKTDGNVVMEMTTTKLLEHFLQHKHYIKF